MGHNLKKKHRKSTEIPYYSTKYLNYLETYPDPCKQNMNICGISGLRNNGAWSPIRTLVNSEPKPNLVNLSH